MKKCLICITWTAVHVIQHTATHNTDYTPGCGHTHHKKLRPFLCCIRLLTVLYHMDSCTCDTTQLVDETQIRSGVVSQIELEASTFGKHACTRNLANVDRCITEV